MAIAERTGVHPSPVPRAATKQGTLEGFEEGGVTKFFGVPYATPPTGALRWQAPRPAAPWTGVRTATQFSAACLQLAPNPPVFRTAAQSEDCLYLNVWTTTLSPGARQPVMVWFHGGGNIVGAGSATMSDGTALAKLGVTVVTLNYRLGAFGFFNDPALGANFATLDHVAALEWVRDNIRAFGGDPDCVMIFGYSAGAVSVRTLAQCPAARGLFHRAAIQSSGGEAPAVAPGWSVERSRNASRELAKALGKESGAALREVPGERLNEAARPLSGTSARKPGLLRTPLDLVWMPFEDGRVVAPGFTGFTAGVPVIFGNVQNEIRIFLDPADTYSPEVLQATIDDMAGPKAAEVARILEAEGGSTYEKIDRLCTTVIWSESEYATMRLVAAAGHPVYSYRFARQSPGSIKSRRLAAHGADIPYIFGTLPPEGIDEKIDGPLSRAMQHAFVSFARTGVPHGTDDAPWVRFDPASPRETLITDKIATAAFLDDPLFRVIASLRKT